MPSRLRGAVILAFAIVLAADHGADRAPGRHRQQSALADFLFARGRPGYPHHRGFGCRLHIPVQGCPDHQIAFRRAQIVGQTVHHPIGEVARRLSTDARPSTAQSGRFRLGCLGSSCIDVAGCNHVIEHHRRPCSRSLEITCRGQARGRFQQTGQHGGLGQVDLCRRFVEIAPGGGIHAIGAGAEVDPVQIQGQDLILGEIGLQPQGQQKFLNFAFQGPLMGQKDVLGQLLADGAAALHDAPGEQIGHHGAAQSDGIDAEMAVKAAVFRGDDRVGQMFRQLTGLHRLAIDIAKAGDLPAFVVQQCQRWFALDGG